MHFRGRSRIMSGAPRIAPAMRRARDMRNNPCVPVLILFHNRYSNHAILPNERVADRVIVHTAVDGLAGQSQCAERADRDHARVVELATRERHVAQHHQCRILADARRRWAAIAAIIHYHENV